MITKIPECVVAQFKVSLFRKINLKLTHKPRIPIFNVNSHFKICVKDSRDIFLILIEIVEEQNVQVLPENKFQ